MVTHVPQQLWSERAVKVNNCSFNISVVTATASPTNLFVIGSEQYAEPVLFVFLSLSIFPAEADNWI